MVGGLFKLSKRELAQPTRYKGAKVKKREGRASGSCISDGGEEKKRTEEGGARTPKLREFGAFEFASPTKKEVPKTRYVD
jgi:ribosome assembly protein YihI (activator of Der GTPase)